MAVIGYVVFGPDNDTYMFQGDAQPARCATCRFVLDHGWVDPSYKLKPGRRPDVSYTYDGCLIVSDNFRAAAKGFAGGTYLSLPSQRGWSILLATRTVTFDTERRETSFDEFCDGCGRFTQVDGATPPFLLDPPVPLPDEFMRTDIEFGSGDELSPLVLVGPGLADALRRGRLVGLDLMPIHHPPTLPGAR